MKKLITFILTLSMLLPCICLYTSAEDEQAWYLHTEKEFEDGVILRMYTDHDTDYCFLAGEQFTAKVEAEGLPEDAVIEYRWFIHVPSLRTTDPSETIDVDSDTSECTVTTRAVTGRGIGTFDESAPHYQSLTCILKVNGDTEYRTNTWTIFVGPRKCTDIGLPGDNWYSEYVRKANYLRIIDPPYFDADEFYPLKQDITRDVFCSMLYGYYWWNSKTNSPAGIFKDVDAENPYFYEIEQCFKYGWVAGVGNGYFNPSGIVTRQEIAVILYAKAKAEPDWPGNDFKDIENTDVLAGYEDRGSIAPWAERAVAWATENGYFTGADYFGKLYFMPTSPVSRAEICCIILNDKT
ncbi:MAG: S-layer homology domain-containing protein [Clostridia bacterium]|nr:S-layer homology domain-containing protein [Clostridia bacterium]